MLAGLSLWVTDRLFEANAEEIISGIGDNGMSVPDAGKWTALALCIGAQVGWAARSFLSPPRVRVEAKEVSGQPNLEPPTIESAAKKRKDMEQLLSHVQEVCLVASVKLMSCSVSCYFSNRSVLPVCPALEVCQCNLLCPTGSMKSLLPLTIRRDFCMPQQSSTADAVNACPQKVSKQMKARLVVDTARGSLTTAAVGSSFILTGNLLAPYLASVSCDLLFSYYQRSKFQELKQKMEQRVTKMMDGLQGMAAASTKVSAYSADANFGMVLSTDLGIDYCKCLSQVCSAFPTQWSTQDWRSHCQVSLQVMLVH